MKAEIDEKGTLKITPETSLESFALKVWMDDYIGGVQDAKDGKNANRFAVLRVDLIKSV